MTDQPQDSNKPSNPASGTGDLTGIVEYGKKLEANGELTLPPPEVVEDFPVSAGVTEHTADFPVTGPSDDAASPDAFQMEGMDTPSSSPGSLGEAIEHTPELITDFGDMELTPEPAGAAEAHQIETENAVSESFAPSPDLTPSTEFAAPLEFVSAPAEQSSISLDPPTFASKHSRTDEIAEAAIPAPLPLTEKLREQRENSPISKMAVPAALPFTVRIDGHLADNERERLLHLLSQENFGITEGDLEPQFQAGRILLPRISEYAAVLIFQCLRDAAVQIQATIADAETENWQPTEPATVSHRMEEDEAIERFPVSLAPTLPELPEFQVIDTLTVSAAIQSVAVEIERSSEYETTLDNLKRELKHKALRKGARGLVGFRVELTSLQLPSQYRLTLMATAVTVSTRVKLPE